MPFRMDRLLHRCLLGLLVCLGACQKAEPPAVDSATQTIAPPATAANHLVKEYWDAHFFDDSKVGYSHTRYETVEENGQQLLRITSESELTLKRFGQEVKQRLEYSSTERPTGELVEIETKMSNESSGAAASMNTVGHVTDGQLKLKVSSLAKTEAASIPWDPSWGGFFVMEQTLDRAPMKPGEKRHLRGLMPGFNQVGDVELEAIRLERTKLLDGERELLRIQSNMKIGGEVLEQVIWTDSEGQTLKQFMPAMNQTAYRTTKEVALGENTGSFDLGQQSIVKVSAPIENPHLTKRVTYAVRFASGDPAKAFTSGATQRLKNVEGQQAELIVRALRPDDELGEEFPMDEGPTAADLDSNTLIQSDDENVVELASQIAANETDPWKIAVALENHVHDFVRNKSFSHALASAAEVVRSREGDCTEHSVLLAALCRARKIPARVAIGLVYYRPSDGFAYHMWTEVWIRDRWIPLDATLGLGGIGAAHIKVSNTNLDGVDPFSQFLPVFRLIGNVGIEVVSIE